MDDLIHERLGRIEDALTAIGKALEKIAILEERQANYKETLAKFEGSVSRAHERIDAQELRLASIRESATSAEKDGSELSAKLWEFVKLIMMVVIGVVLAKSGIGK